MRSKANDIFDCEDAQMVGRKAIVIICMVTERGDRSFFHGARRATATIEEA
jgi:hypothetical protein